MTDAAPNPTAPERNVFISYASQDKAVADAVCEALERAGVVCWIAPRDVTPGEFYAESIVHAIDSTKVIVLVLSQNASDSQHVLSEVERARSRRHPVVSLRIDAVPLPAALEYFLNTSQWLDASTTGVERALPRLVDAVKSVLTQPSAAGGGNPSPRVAPAAPASAALPKSRRNRLLLATGIALVAVTLAVLFAPKFGLSTHSPAGKTTNLTSTAALPISDKSIAVLPFADMSEKHDQEYMSDGIAEELLNLLAQAPGLKVIARTSSFSFKGKAVDIAEIAKRLNVAHVLEGSVRKSGDKIRITAQLIRTADSTHLWSETYDRPLKDVFAVQDEIASAIVQALQIRLAGGELSRQKGGTQNLEAYQLYLRAMSEYNKQSRESLEAARTYALRAVKLDPGYAYAWVTLGWLEADRAEEGVVPMQNGYEGARQMAQHALEISSQYAEPHLLLAYIHRTYDWNWDASQREVSQALAIDPKSFVALLVSPQLFATLGQWPRAEQQLRAAIVLDPLSTVAHMHLALTLYRAGRLSEAEAAYRELINLAPAYAYAQAYLARTLLAERKTEAALATVRLEPEESDRLSTEAVVLQSMGRHAEADELLQVLIKKYSGYDAYGIAFNYAYRNDPDHALQWLERAYLQKDGSLGEIVGEPLFKNLWNDPRFKAFLKKMNLPE